MQGLIVAAGPGTRLRDIAASKPLAMLHGRPLIQHVIEQARAGGIDEFVVVTGYEAPPLEAFLRRLSMRGGFPIRVVRNSDWRLANGHSVAAAASSLNERFVLMMADHLFDPLLLAGLLAAPVTSAEVTLAVDRRLTNPLVDLEDVTRVLTDDRGSITTIGKLIESYDAFDTGVFLASHALIDAIGDDINAGGSGGISGGMMRLAAMGLAATHDIGDAFWLDVDDAIAYAHAERLCA